MIIWCATSGTPCMYPKYYFCWTSYASAGGVTIIRVFRDLDWLSSISGNQKVSKKMKLAISGQILANHNSAAD